MGDPKEGGRRVRVQESPCSKLLLQRRSLKMNAREGNANLQDWLFVLVIVCREETPSLDL